MDLCQWLAWGAGLPVRSMGGLGSQLLMHPALLGVASQRLPWQQGTSRRLCGWAGRRPDSR